MSREIPVDLGQLDEMIEDADRIVAAVLVLRVVDVEGGMRDVILTADGEGDELDVVSAVGMTAVAQHTLLSETSVER